MVESDNRALSERRDEINALPRPSPSEQGPNLKQAVEAIRETPDLWHVYAWESRWAWTSTVGGDQGKEQCWQYFADHFAGRIADPSESVDVLPTSESQPSLWPWKLEIRMPTMRGSFKLRSQADQFVAAHQEFDRPKVVARNSKDEFELKNYGIRKLLVS